MASVSGDARPGWLRGSPAALNLAARGGRRMPNAPAATLLDLVDRGFLEWDESAPGGPDVVVHHAGHEGLREHERLVLDLVRGMAPNGRVPAAALRVGEAAGDVDTGPAWLATFHAEVSGEARSLGWVRQRFDPRSSLMIVAAVGGAALLAYAGVRLLGYGELAGVAGVVVLLLGVLLVMRLRIDSVTEAGRQAVAAAKVAVAQGPVGAGYRLALGMDADPVRAGLLRPDDPSAGWVERDGQWREVAVVYPRRRSPWYRLLVTGVLSVMAVMLFNAAVQTSAWLLAVVALVVGVPAAVTGVVTVIGLVPRRRFELSARVVRRRSTGTDPEQEGPASWWVALDDDPTADPIVAWHADATSFAAAVPGAVVRVRVDGGRHTIRSLEVLQGSPRQGPTSSPSEIIDSALAATGVPALIESLSAPATRVAEVVLRSDIEAIVRRPFRSVTDGSAPGPIRTAIWRSTDKPKVEVFVQLAQGLAARTVLQSGKAARAVGDHRVTAAGKGRAWTRKPGSDVVVSITVRGGDETWRDMVAQQLAGIVADRLREADM